MFIYLTTHLLDDATLADGQYFPSCGQLVVVTERGGPVYIGQFLCTISRTPNTQTNHGIQRRRGRAIGG